MYDDEDHLNDAVAEQKAAREQAQAHAQAQAQAQAHEQALQAANFYAYQHHSLSYRPTPPLLDMPFVPPDQMVQHNQYMAYHPVPQPPFDFYGNGFAPAPFQPTEYNPHFQHAEYNPQFQPAAVHPQHQNMTIQADTTALQLPAVHPQHQDMTTPADTTALQQFAAHMTQEKQIAAQPSANPTRSCCSTRREAAQPLMQQTSSQFNIPGSRPRDQFGCQTCASFDCTCVRCPELGQAPNGAWSQMCGRGGELDGELDGPVLLKLEQSSSQETQDIFQGIPEHQTPLQDFTHQPQDFSQQPQDVFHRQAQDFTHQPQDVFLQPQDFTQHHQEVFHQSQGFSQQSQDAFQGLSELQAPLEDYSQLPSLDVPHLPEFQFGQTQPTFDEALGYGDLSQISTRW